MTTRAIKAAVLSTAILGAVLAPAAAASARSLTINDSTADTWEDVYDPSSGTETWTEAGSQLNVDVIKTVVKHSATRISFTVTYDDLKARDVRYGLVDRMRFDQGPKADVIVDATGKWKGQVSLAEDKTGSRISCPGLTHEIDYTANTVAVSVPRSCVGKPAWVEIGEFGVGFHSDDAGDHQYVDNAETDGHGYASWSAKIRRG